MYIKKNKIFEQNGFTLLEIIIIVFIFGLLFSIIVFNLKDFRNNQILKSASEKVFSIISDAKSSATSSLDFSEYGVYFSSESITLFKGKDYDEELLSNEIYLLPQGVFVSEISLTSGASSLYFNKITGSASAVGYIKLELGNLSKSIFIGEGGVISIN